MEENVVVEAVETKPQLKKKKHLGFWIAFPIGFVLLLLLMIFYLDLANGPFALLVLALLAFVGLAASSILLLKKKMRFRLIPWGGFILVSVIVILSAKPAVVALPAVSNRNPEPTPVLHLTDGPVRGVYNEDKSVAVYAGIPYADKPERWTIPSQVTPWTETKDCSYFAPKAYQPDSNALMDSLVDIYAQQSWHPDFNDGITQNKSEDCLYLNIFKPNVEATNLPVLVYIHGGSLTNGSSADPSTNGEAMAKKGVIMITIAYRLGVFGYFAHPSLYAENGKTTGNYGLLDQIEALRFIKRNAASFGGNPENITIAGESAGSSSVSALCASPLTEGLFQRAIGESSSLVLSRAPHTFRTREKAYKAGEKILKEFGCTSVADLRKVPADKLVKTAVANSAMTLDDYALPKTPYEIYQAQEERTVDLLNGYNVKEADAFVVPQYLFSPTNKNNIRSRLAEYFDDDTADKILALPRYIDAVEKDAFSAFNEIMSVFWFIYPHHSWSKMALQNGRKVYRYQFTKENGYYGTYHSGEIVYAYGNLHRIGKDFAYGKADDDLSAAMLSYWSNFAKTGNPNGEGLKTWEPYCSGGPVMELGETIGSIPDRYLDLYPLIEEFNAKPEKPDPDEL